MQEKFPPTHFGSKLPRPGAHVMEIKTPALFVAIVTVLRKSKMVDEFS